MAQLSQGLTGRAAGHKFAQIVGPFIRRAEAESAANGALPGPQVFGGGFAKNNGALGLVLKDTGWSEGNSKSLEVVRLHVVRDTRVAEFRATDPWRVSADQRTPWRGSG